MPAIPGAREIDPEAEAARLAKDRTGLDPESPGRAMQWVLASAGIHAVILGSSREDNGRTYERLVFRLADGRGMAVDAWFTPEPGDA